jgi:hypothetical protein
MSLFHTNLNVTNDLRHDLLVIATTYHSNDYYATGPDKSVKLHTIHPGESRFYSIPLEHVVRATIAYTGEGHTTKYISENKGVRGWQRLHITLKMQYRAASGTSLIVCI